MEGGRRVTRRFPLCRRPLRIFGFHLIQYATPFRPPLDRTGPALRMAAPLNHTGHGRGTKIAQRSRLT